MHNWTRAQSEKDMENISADWVNYRETLVDKPRLVIADVNCANLSEDKRSICVNSHVV